jgi:hypothetical protein
LSTVLKNYGVASDKALAVPVTVKDQSGAGYWLGLFLQNILPVVIVIAFMFFLENQVIIFYRAFSIQLIAGLLTRNFSNLHTSF